MNEVKYLENFEALAAEIGGIQAAAIFIERPEVRYMTDLKGKWVKIWFNSVGQIVMEYPLNWSPPDFS